MNKNSIRRFLAVVLLALTWTVQAAVATGAKVALVIGNANYSSAPLRNPANDAVAIASTLRSLGYEVIERTNVSQKEMNRAITLFGTKLAKDSTAVFYYAGHGLQAKGKNYLVPIDAEITSEAAIRSESVDFDMVLDQFTNAGSQLNIAILDACRNNPYENRFRSASSGLAQLDAPKGTLIAYSTAPSKTAMDGFGKNGVYTQELVKQMRMPGQKIEDAFKRIRINVANISNDQQIPWESSSLTGDYYFMPGKVAGNGAASAPIDPARQLAFWNAIKDSTRPEDFQEYIDRFPSGDFAGLATSRIIALRNEQENRQVILESAVHKNVPAATSEPTQSPKELGVDLVLAVTRNDVTTAQQLIAKGADVNCPDCARGRYAGMTPLMLAVQMGAQGPENAMVRLLLRHKANPNARAADGRTPLAFAANAGINNYGGAVDTVIELMMAGADPNLTGGRNGYTPVFWWAAASLSPSSQPFRTVREELYRDFLAIAKTFHQFGANLDYRDKDGWNALHLAAAMCNPHGVLLMQALGLDGESNTYRMMTAREIVARKVQDEGDSRQCQQTLDALNNKELVKTWKQVAYATAPLLSRR